MSYSPYEKYEKIFEKIISYHFRAYDLYEKLMYDAIALLILSGILSLGQHDESFKI